MKNLIETIDEYNQWKSKIKKVLDENFFAIISLIIDAFGENELIPMRKEIGNSRYQTETIKSAVLINRSHIYNEPYIWFFSNSNFYLIEKTKDSSVLNIKPYFHGHTNYDNSWLHNAPTHKARFDNEVSFIVDLLEWHEHLLDVLIERMNKIKPSRADEIIKKLASVAN